MYPIIKKKSEKNNSCLHLLFHKLIKKLTISEDKLKPKIYLHLVISHYSKNLRIHFLSIKNYANNWI
jgi:hypothetical protein